MENGDQEATWLNSLKRRPMVAALIVAFTVVAALLKWPAEVIDNYEKIAKFIGSESAESERRISRSGPEQ